MNLKKLKPTSMMLAALSLLGAPLLLAASYRANTSPKLAFPPVAVQQTVAVVASASKAPDVAAIERRARQRWLAQNPSRAEGAIRLGSYDEVAHLVHRSNWDALKPAQRSMLISIVRQAQQGIIGALPCFAPGTDLKIVQAFEGIASSLQFYRTRNYWTTTASGPHSQGTPMVLTWSIVPDGTSISGGATDEEVTAPSTLIADLNAIYGSQDKWLPLVRRNFARWSAVSGIRYIEETKDDGVAIDGSVATPGVLGVRGDVRIGAHSIDDSSGILAYNYFPNISDMVIDSDDLKTTDPRFPGFFTDISQDSLGLRNVLEHEHGHGLGFSHSCPVNETKLMEPFVSYKFDGPQLDDIQNVQRGYGDTLEEDDNQGAGTNLGILKAGVVTKSLLSIDSNTDVDFFRFTTSGGKKISIKATPLGGSYLEGPQNNPFSQDGCSLGITFNAGAQRDLRLAVLNNDGKIIAQSNVTGTGGIETLAPAILPQNTGPFAVRVSGDDKDVLQLYDIEITLADYNEGPGLSVSDPSILEGNSGQTEMQFGVFLNSPITDTVTVKYATSSGSATLDTDYLAASGTLTIPAGQLSGTVKVPVIGDTLDESDETIKLTISEPTKSFILDAEGIGTIRDDDDGPGLSINDVRVTEGDEGTTKATFTVTLAQASTKSVQVRLRTSDGTATSGSDYSSTVGLISFGIGETSKNFSVTVLGDISSEANETFFLTLSEPLNAFIAREKGTATIIDDDALQLSISDVSVVEGDSGGEPVTAVFTVALKAVSGKQVKVNYATRGGTAAASIDFDNRSGTLVFAPGELSKNVEVPVKGDAIYETVETFTVRLSSPSNVIIADGEGVGTITDNDTPPQVSIFATSVIEGNSGAKEALFIVQLSKPVVLENQTVKVNYATQNGTARDGSDYTSTRGTLVFAPGVRSKVIAVPIKGDVLNEADEKFTVNLSSLVGATFKDARATGTIINDDEMPKMSISNVSVTEGDGDSNNAVFEIKLSAVSGQNVRLNYVTRPITATEGVDYAYTYGTLIFAAGETSKTISVQVKDDILDELTETFTLNFTSLVNASSIGDAARGTVTILDNDEPPTLSIDDASVVEGNSGTTSLFFSVKLSTFSSREIKVNWVTRGGTATAGTDFESASGTLVFPAGEISKVIKINVKTDTLAEGDEQLRVELNNALNAFFDKKVGVGIIANDDSIPVGATSAGNS